MHQLYFSESQLVAIEASVSTRIALFEEKRHKTIDTIKRKKDKIRDDLKYLRSNKLELLKTGVYSAEDFMNEEIRLNKELAELSHKETISDEAMHQTVKDVVKFSELLKHVSLYYDYAKALEKDQIVRIIFSELLISDNSVFFKLNNGFAVFEKPFNALGDPTGWVSELYKQKFVILSCMKLLRTLLPDTK